MAYRTSIDGCVGIFRNVTSEVLRVTIAICALDLLMRLSVAPASCFRDSQLSSVLETGMGCSPVLSILYLELCSRLGIRMEARPLENGRWVGIEYQMGHVIMLLDAYYLLQGILCSMAAAIMRVRSFGQPTCAGTLCCGPPTRLCRQADSSSWWIPMARVACCHLMRSVMDLVRL